MPKVTTTTNLAPTNETLPRLVQDLLPFTVVDLFSGAGGMTCGFWQTGFQLRGAVDKQVGKPSELVPCNDTYQLNFGITPLNEDLGTLDPQYLLTELDLQPNELTVLIACPPCTGYSQKRHQNLVSEDARNELVARTALYVQAFLPAFLVMENVPEMVRGNFTGPFNHLYTTLRQLNYTVSVQVLDFKDLGLPQRRRRAIVVARRNNGPVPDLRARFIEGPPRTVRQALANFENTLEANESLVQHDPLLQSAAIGRRSSTVLERCKLIRAGGGRWSRLNLAQLSPEEQGVLTPRIRAALESDDLKTYPDCYGTMNPDEPSPTLVRQCGDIGTGPWFHWQEDRMLSPREMAILQGFPYIPAADGFPFYRFAGTTSRFYQQIGNAVPPLVSRILAEEIRDILLGVAPGIPGDQVQVWMPPASKERTTGDHT